MQDKKTAAAEEPFTTKLDIPMVSTSMFERVVDFYAGTDLVAAAMGKSGIGKTAIPKQAAARRRAPYVSMDGPTTNIDDFHVPTTAADTRLYYDRRIPRKFKCLIDYVEKMREENGGEFPAGKNPILSIEELNRTIDKHVTRAFFTLLNERTIGDVHLDPAIQIVVTLNPSGGGMMVNEFERDPAMRRRIKIFGVTANYGDFIRYAKKSNFHDRVVAYLEAQPHYFYDDAAAASGKVYPCPATWDDVSKLCYQLEAQDQSLSGTEARAFFASAIGLTATEGFVDFIRDATTVITPDEVLQSYSEKSAVRGRFKKLITDNRLDRVSALSVAVAMKLYENTKKQPAVVGKQLAMFMTDMPEEVMLAFIRELSEQSKTAPGGQQFLIALNGLMAKEKDGYFSEAVARLQRAQQKGKEEAEKDGYK